MNSPCQVPSRSLILPISQTRTDRPHPRPRIPHRENHAWAWLPTSLEEGAYSTVKPLSMICMIRLDGRSDTLWSAGEGVCMAVTRAKLKAPGHSSSSLPFCFKSISFSINFQTAFTKNLSAFHLSAVAGPKSVTCEPCLLRSSHPS